MPSRRIPNFVVPPAAGRAARVATLSAAVAALCACGGGGGGDGGEQAAAPPPAAVTPSPSPAASAPAPAHALTIVAQADRSYASVKAADGATVEVFRASDGNVTQTRYANPTTGERMRVLYGTDGLPQRLFDEATEASLVIQKVSPARTDFRLVDSSGTFVAGYAVLDNNGQQTVAPINGTPVLAGQLTGQIAGALQAGSFTVLPGADDGLGAATPLPLSATQLADALAQASAGLQLHVARPLSAHERALAVSGVDRRAVLGGLAAGLFVGIGAPAGSGLAAGLIAGAMLSYGLQYYLLPVVDAVRSTDSIEDLPAALAPVFDGFTHNRSALDALQASLSGALATFDSDVVSRLFDAASDTAATALDPSGLPAADAEPPAISTTLNGFGVDQQGATYAYNGSVDPAGALVLTGSAGTAQVEVLGTVTAGVLSGTASGALGAGNVSGAVNALGQCATLQQSGGQGTFSYAFDAVASAGTLPFYRDAYSIPDEFRVISNGITLYATNGLVSGSESATLPLNGSRIVFVNVNAPRSGTQWELQLGCPA